MWWTEQIIFERNQLSKVNFIFRQLFHNLELVLFEILSLNQFIQVPHLIHVLHNWVLTKSTELINYVFWLFSFVWTNEISVLICNELRIVMLLSVNKVIEAFNVLVHVFMLRWLVVDVTVNCLLTNFLHLNFTSKHKELIRSFFIFFLCFTNFRLERMLLSLFFLGCYWDLIDYVKITERRLFFLIVKFLFTQDVLESWTSF